MSSSKIERSGHGRKRPASRIISEDNLALIQVGFDHMDEGISMYDSELHLVAWNKAFAELVEFPDDLLQVGRPIADLIRFNIKRDTYGEGEPEKILASRLALLEQGERQTFDRARSDGRVVEINWFPLSDGGFVITYRDVTERRAAAEQSKRAEEELRKSQNLFEAFMSNNREVAGIKDEDGRLLFVNDVYKKSTKTEGEEWRGKTDFDLFPKETAEQFRQNDLAVLKSGEPMIFEETVLQDGTPQHWLISKFPIEQPGGKRLLGFNGIDVTERKQAEQALRESEQRFESFMTHLPAIAFMKDEDGKHLYLNDAQARLLGIEEDSWLGKTDFDMFPAEVANRMRRNDLDVLEKGGAHFFEETTEIDGRRRHWLVSKFVQDDMAGKKLLCGIGIDITERKLAEEKLHQSEQRYRELFDDSPVAIWEEDWSRIKQMLEDLARDGVTDWPEYFDGHREQLKRAYDLAEILEISLAALDIYGATNKEELEQSNIAEEVIEEELDAFREIVLSFLAGQMFFDIESKDTTMDESEITIRRRVAIPPKCRDNWSRVIYAIEDITGSKRMEEQLQQAQKMEAVGQLTGGVAHEFNNLLMVILGNIEALESRLEKDDPLQSYVSSASKGALRGAELTQSLLAFSRKQRLEAGETDLGELVSGMQNLFQRTLGETIKIETDLDEELWLTSADAGQIEAALLNFVLNARDAMPGGGTITLRTSNRVMTADTATHYDCVEPGDYVTLEVRDSGSGMTDEQIEHAFEPFYTTKEVGKGTGLGLSVAYGFAKQSGGCLEIESEPGQGTTVRLSLPRAVEKKTGTEVERSAPEPATGSGKILIVEDDADVRALAVSQLTDLGYQIIEAEDGPAALALLDEHPDVDLLFSDVVLPGGMSGPQSAVKAHHKHPDLKVLFTSGYPEKDIEDLDVGGKNVAILGKPYRKTELAEAIAAAMKSG